MDRQFPERNWQEQYTKFGSYEHEIARGNVRGAYPISGYGKLVASSAVTNTLIQTQDGSVLHVPQSVQMSMPFPIQAGQIVGFVATCDKGATITAGFMGWIEDAS